jgi:hypothetical protein
MIILYDIQKNVDEYINVVPIDGKNEDQGLYEYFKVKL